MWPNKWIVYITFPLTVASLLIAFSLYNHGAEFWSNVLLGVFGSSSLSCFMAGINYLNERQKTLENFLYYGRQARNNLNKYPLQGSNEEKARAILQMNEYDYQAFDDAYGGISFLFHAHSLRYKIYDSIYGCIGEARDRIFNGASEIKRFNLLSDPNSGALSECIAEVDKILVNKSDICVDKTQMESFSNPLVEQLSRELNGFFYDLLYPWKRGKD